MPVPSESTQLDGNMFPGARADRASRSPGTTNVSLPEAQPADGAVVAVAAATRSLLMRSFCAALNAVENPTPDQIGIRAVLESLLGNRADAISLARECERSLANEPTEPHRREERGLTLIRIHDLLNREAALLENPLTADQLSDRVFDSQYQARPQARIAVRDAIDQRDWDRLIAMCFPKASTYEFVTKSVASLRTQGLDAEAGRLLSSWDQLLGMASNDARQRELQTLDLAKAAAEKREIGPLLSGLDARDFSRFQTKIVRALTEGSAELIVPHLLKETPLELRVQVLDTLQAHLGSRKLLASVRECGMVDQADVIGCIARREQPNEAFALLKESYRPYGSMLVRWIVRKRDELLGDLKCYAYRAGAAERSLAAGDGTSAIAILTKTRLYSLDETAAVAIERGLRAGPPTISLPQIELMAGLFPDYGSRIRVLTAAVDYFRKQRDCASIEKLETKLIAELRKKPEISSVGMFREVVDARAHLSLARAYADLGRAEKVDEHAGSVLDHLRTAASWEIRTLRGQALSIFGRFGNYDVFLTRIEQFGSDDNMVPAAHEQETWECDPLTDLRLADVDTRKLQHELTICAANVQIISNGDLRPERLKMLSHPPSLHAILKRVAASGAFDDVHGNYRSLAISDPQALTPRQRGRFAEAVGLIPAGEVDSFIARSPSEEQGVLRIKAKLSALRGSADPETRSAIARECGASLEALVQSKPPQRKAVQVACKLIAESGESAAIDALLTVARDSDTPAIHRARILSGLADCGSLRGQRAAFEGSLDARIDAREARILITKLSRAGYLERNLETWSREYDRASSREVSRRAVDAIRDVGRAGMVPSAELLDFLLLEQWIDKEGRPISTVPDRIASLKERIDELSKIDDPVELVRALASDRNSALSYYAYHSPKTIFNLVGNYSFGKFREVLEIASELRRHEARIEELGDALVRTGHEPTERDVILSNIRSGRHPLTGILSNISKGIIIRLDVSDSSKLEQANLELGSALGARQLGLLLKGPLYRGYLEQIPKEGERKLLADLKGAETLEERARVIDAVEEKYPEFRARIVYDLETKWSSVMVELGLRLQISAVLEHDEVPASCAQLLAGVASRRPGIVASHEQALLALKGEHPELKALDEQIRKKTKAIGSLSKGAEFKAELREKITGMKQELEDLKTRRATIDASKVADRFEHLRPEERRAKIQEEADACAVAARKDSSSIFMSLALGVLPDQVITERDANLAKEVAINVEGPLRITKDVLDAGNARSAKRAEKAVTLRMLDKCQDLMTYVRFADSKICCYSSSNYEMVVAHGMQNKHWVARALSDPLTYVFVVEEVSDNPDQPRKNLGFVLGWYGDSVLEEGGESKLGTVLNGVYLSTGNDSISYAAVLNGIERSLTGPLKAAFQFSASTHGGQSSSLPDGYEAGTMTITRYRAIEGTGGSPEHEVYDDVAKAINVPTASTGIFKVVYRV